MAPAATPDRDRAEVLLSALRSASGDEALTYLREPTPMTGGFDAEMYRFSLRDAPADLDGELVARIVRDPRVARLEATFQGGVADLGFPTPAVRLIVDDAAGLGGALIVMDHVEGRPPLDGLGVTTVLTGLPRLVRGLPDQLAAVAARLHSVEPSSVEAGVRALGPDVRVTALDLAERLVGQAEEMGEPELTCAGEQLLLAQQSGGGPLVVTHGDLHPFNLIVAEQGTVLVDWTLGAIAHPAFTLSFTQLVLENPPVPAPAAVRVGLDAVGRAMSRRFQRTYRALAHEQSHEHLDPRQLAWHRRLHALRILVESAGWSGTRRDAHPWVSLEPAARATLELPAA